jgi:hypothetical protein
MLPVFGTRKKQAGGEETIVYYKFKSNRINIPPYGVNTAEQAMKNLSLLKYLVNKIHVFDILVPATEEEYRKYIDPDGSTEEKVWTIEEAREEYYRLTGQKAGRRNMETLLKAIANYSN